MTTPTTSICGVEQPGEELDEPGLLVM